MQEGGGYSDHLVGGVQVALSYDDLYASIRWNPERPIRELRTTSKYIEGQFRRFANFMLAELVAYEGKSMLIPAVNPDTNPTQYRRIMTDFPPDWYKGMRHEIPWFEKRRSVSALERIVEDRDEAFREFGEDSPVIMPYWFSYCLHYRDHIMNMLVNGFEEHAVEVPPDEVVRTYFLTGAELPPF